MSESDWLWGVDSKRLWLHVSEAATPRKARLLCVACFRSVLRETHAPEVAELVDAFELLADGGVGRDAIREPRRRVYAARPPADNPDLFRLLKAAKNLSLTDVLINGVLVTSLLEDAAGSAADRYAEREVQSLLVRDLFGNPFRSVAFSPEWRTDTAVTLAQTMYDARDFSAMPILADALQDAGCDSDDVLNHCRGHRVHLPRGFTDSPHARGCWVVDQVLGLK